LAKGGGVSTPQVATDYKLEPSEPGGLPPQRVIDELVEARTYAKNAAEGFADAIKAQAAKFKLKPAALRKYIAAVEADKVDAVKAETEQLADLIG
jgi:hypothetical protein